MNQKKFLFTGGSGLLGSEFKKNLPDIIIPRSTEFDVTNYEQMEAFIKEKEIETIFHAAAFTSPPKVDLEPIKGLEVNIIGTSNVVKLCAKYGIKLIYVCTDYVFKGDQGNYKEDDSVFPVNKYAWSKLGGECAVRMYDNHLIIRTSFGPNVFPYEKAFTDQWTSRLSVGQVVPKMIELIESGATGTYHVGAQRRTVFEYAKSLDAQKEIKELSTSEVNFTVPKDTSLDCAKFEKLISDRQHQSIGEQGVKETSTINK